MLCSVYIHNFRSDTSSREEIPSGGTSDKAFAHYSVIRESDPATRKLHGGSGPVLRCGDVGHRRREYAERDDGPFHTSSEDASVCHRSSPPVATRYRGWISL